MACMVMVTNKFEICWADRRLGIPTGVDVAVLSDKAIWRKNSFSFRDLHLFFLRPSADWMRFTHIVEGLCFIQFHRFKCISHLKNAFIAISCWLTKQLGTIA